MFAKPLQRLDLLHPGFLTNIYALWRFGDIAYRGILLSFLRERRRVWER